MLRVVSSVSAALRLDAAASFLASRPRDSQVLIVGASRGAADDLARAVAREQGALFGSHRFSLTQLAARLAAPILAAGRLSPATRLGVQAVATRALFEASEDRALSYFEPVSDTPGFPRALARTLEEIALAAVGTPALAALPGVGADLADLLARFDDQLLEASAVDRAVFLRTATRATRGAGWPYGDSVSALLLDVAVTNAAERELVEALLDRASDGLVTVPAGDRQTRQVFDRLAQVEDLQPVGVSDLEQLRRYLFAPEPPAGPAPAQYVELFSAPGEGREAVEIARRVLGEARRGVPFDRMAVVVRSPQHYAGLLEHALTRAGVPTYFERGVRRPHPAGRAFLSLLACATENLSARRFAEYLSLGEVPEEEEAAAHGDVFPRPTDEVFGALAERADAMAPEPESSDEGSRGFRAPWKWEPLLAESRVVASAERWTRRLNGLAEECELQRREIERSEPDSPKAARLRRKVGELAAFGRFALPVVRTLAAFPPQATWAEWLDRFERLAPRVLRRPDRVLRVLADLRPMGAVGPIRLAEAALVLADRLTTIESERPARRHGRVFVAGPEQMRGRRFDVVFIPALAERMFPQRLREDPLLLDSSRAALDAGLPTEAERADVERLGLRLAVGAAEHRLYVSFPTLEVADGRPKVPSLYALEVWRAMTGTVPSADELQRAAAGSSGATLAWPAPASRDEAIDALEHDLATLGQLVLQPETRARGRAQYMLRLNACLQRSVRERHMRSLKAWSHWDGLVRVTERTAAPLAAERLIARPYSPTALQRYAVCPYQFLLSAIFRLEPAQDLEPLQHLDPLTRGSLFHAMQSSFYRRLAAAGSLPVTAGNREHALETLDDAVYEVSAQYHELLAPAVERVWHDEIGGIRRDLRLWVDRMVEDGTEWVPRSFEWSFGLGGATSGRSADRTERDPGSVPEPVAVDGRFPLRGSIDLVEERAGTGELRVTDHKTGRYRGREHLIVGGGEVLQPVLYGVALETATKRPVVEGRLYYATTAGGYRDVRIGLTPDTRRAGVEVLEIVDRGVERGFLAPAPIARACTWCDFRVVCGPTAERRIGRKSLEPLADLIELRNRP